MRVNKKNNDIITCSSVLNHLRSKRVCVFYSLLFLALLEVRTYSRKKTSIDWRDSRRVTFSRFYREAMVASTVFEADSARCFHSNALGRANIATRQVFSNVQKFKDWIQKCWLFLSLLPLCDGCILTDTWFITIIIENDKFQQVLLWSVVLVPGDANSVWNLSAQQYYQRETGNLKSFQQQPRFQIQVRVLDLYLESLAHKQEHLWRKEEFNLYDKNLQPLHPEPPDKRTGIGLSLSSLGRCLLEEVVSSKFSKSTAIGERISNYNLNVRV